MGISQQAVPHLANDTELVELSIPALPELLSLPRMTAAAVAARGGFDVEEIEDVRLAIEELCLAAFDGRGPGRLSIRLGYRDSVLEVDCTFKPSDRLAEVATARSDETAALTEQLLTALANEHGTDVEDGVARAWFRKSRLTDRVE
jgi:hypothetical protein